MSWTSNVRAEKCVHRSVNRRTVARIQNNVIKRSKRCLVSRVLRSKTDKDAIAAWRQDLDRILQIFTVRPLNPIRQLLICYLQAELLMNTHLTVVDTHVAVQKTHLTVQDTNLTVQDTRSMVVDIHQKVLAQAGPDGKNSSVSTGLYQPTTEH